MLGAEGHVPIGERRRPARRAVPAAFGTHQTQHDRNAHFQFALGVHREAVAVVPGPTAPPRPSDLRGRRGPAPEAIPEGSMRKRLTTVTVVAVVLAAAAMVFATVQTAPFERHTVSVSLHELSIKAPATAKSGKTITVTGAEARTPSHDVTATLQYKLSSASSWKNGASASLKNGAYSLKWKAPAKKGAYQLRVRVAAGGSSNLSATKKVTGEVKRAPTSSGADERTSGRQDERTRRRASSQTSGRAAGRELPVRVSGGAVGRRPRWLARAGRGHRPARARLGRTSLGRPRRSCAIG